MSLSTKLFYYLPFFILTVISYGHRHSRSCIHDHLDFEPELLPESKEDDFEGRILQTYQNIRILLDFSTLTGAPANFTDYVVNSILPPALNYFQAALKVKPVSGKLNAAGYSSICGGTVTLNSTYSSSNGVYADLVIFVTQSNESDASFLAFASPCLVQSTTKRPIFGRLNFNLAFLSATTDDVQIEADIATIMHEMTHILGFSSSLYSYYINPATNAALTGHVFTRTINGNSVTVLNVEPLTTKLRTYFNCSTLEGAYLENEGSSGSAGSHFERRIFYNEYMTASDILDARVTQFTLALLEGSGWYQVDYSLAETVTYGKNKGCSFLDTPCMTSGTVNSEEFCSPLANRGCSWTKRGGSYCGAFTQKTDANLSSSMNYWGNNTIVSDTFSDNCPTYQHFSNLDCEDSTQQTTTRLPNAEFYGYGGKCFIATIYPSGYYSQPSGYCFKQTCEAKTGGGYNLKVYIGSTTVTCTAETTTTVTGYGGVFYCPDPTKFCTQVETEGFCKRSCSARGTCVNKVCQCTDGWTFHDCSKKAYVDNCSRCAGGDPNKSSCYGDSCECNPNNTTCMCQLGLLTGVVCNLKPTAAFSITSNNLVVSFNGSTSTDSDGSIVSYAWEFGESTSGSSNTASGSTATHTYATAGSYFVTLTVTDNQGATGTSTQTITVGASIMDSVATSVSPIASFTVNKNYLQVTFDGSTSTTAGNIVSYTWNFGESTSGSSNTANGITAVHNYAKSGSYIVTLTVTDNQGATGTSTQTITVIAPNVNPVSAFTAIHNLLQVKFDGTRSSDSDGSIVSYAWDFGESTSGSSNTASGSTVIHTYAQSGSYIVTLVVTDNNGSSSTSSQNITVSTTNISPVADFDVARSYLQATFYGSSSIDFDGNIVSYRWNFGDPLSGISNRGTGITASHIFTSSGSYNVTLTVYDNQGVNGIAIQTITVTSPVTLESPTNTTGPISNTTNSITNNTTNASSSNSVSTPIIIGAAIGGVIVVSGGMYVGFKMLKTRGFRKKRLTSYKPNSPSNLPLAKSPDASRRNELSPMNIESADPSFVSQLSPK